jgi:hypothetical protein
MHAQELVLKHALGLVTRRKGGQLTDSFPAGCELRDVCKSFATKIMDKKAKGRYLEYEQMSLQTYKVKPVKLKTPNDTRVSGVYSLFSSLLRSKSLCQVLVGASKYLDVYRQCIISNDDWKLIAEFESIMSLTHHLAMVSQSQEAGEIAFSWYEVAMCRYLLKSKTRKFKVIDCTHSWSPDTPFENIPTVRMGYNELTTTSQEFIDRLINEFQRYFPAPDSDQLVAMHLHPVIQKNCFE